MAVKAKATITLAAVKDIDSIYWFYKLQDSTASAPTKSGLTAAASKGDPPSGWSDSEPTYTSGSTQTLYIVEQTYYTDGTNEFSEVSKSTSYEAAKAAWNKADNAEGVANTKAKTFRTTNGNPSAPYSVGDIWVNTVDVYAPTLDDEIVSGKTYYTNSNGTYTAVGTPVVASLGDYYEKYEATTTYICSSANNSLFSEADWVVASADNTTTQNDLDRLASELAGRYDSLLYDLGIARTDFTEAIQAVEGSYVSLAALENSYMRIGQDANHNPVLILGGNDNPYKMAITNQGFQILYAENPLAYFTENAVSVQRNLQFGNFAWFDRTTSANTHHLTLKISQ